MLRRLRRWFLTRGWGETSTLHYTSTRLRWRGWRPSNSYSPTSVRISPGPITHGRSPQQQLFLLRKLRKLELNSKLLSNFYRCTVESILTNSIIVWYGNSTTQDRKALQRVIKTAQLICGVPHPPLQDIYNTHFRKRAHNVKDRTQPEHTLFTLLPSGRCYRSVKAKTTRLNNSFYPQAIRLLNHWLSVEL